MNTYTITHNLSNVTQGNVTIIITPDTGYDLPSSISVTNGTLISYNSTTGEAVISGYGSNTVIEAVCTAVQVAQSHSVNLNLAFEYSYNVTYHVYDGEDDETGVLIGTYTSNPASAQQYTITSGHIYVTMTSNGSYGAMIMSAWLTNESGISVVDYDSDWILLSVTSDGNGVLHTDED